MKTIQEIEMLMKWQLPLSIGHLFTARRLEENLVFQDFLTSAYSIRLTKDFYIRGFSSQQLWQFKELFFPNISGTFSNFDNIKMIELELYDSQKLEYTMLYFS